MELNKMTKSDLINYITDKNRELVEMPSLSRGMTMGTMVIFDRLVQYLCNVRASASNTWKYLSRLMDVFADVEGNITITLKGGSHSISIADLLKTQESEWNAQTAHDIVKMIAEKGRDHDVADHTVLYRPIGFEKPFIYNGKRYNRDELKAMGRDFQAHDAIAAYTA